MNTQPQFDTVEVTQGTNGYPSRIYNVIVADTYSELMSAQATGAYELIMIRKRDGWALWESLGSHYGNLLNMPADDSDTVIAYRQGDDINQIAFDHVVGSYTSTSYALSDAYPNATIDELISILNEWRERISEIVDSVTEGKDCDIWMDNPNPTSVDFVVDAESETYRSDVWTYRLALKTI